MFLKVIFLFLSIVTTLTQIAPLPNCQSLQHVLNFTDYANCMGYGYPEVVEVNTTDNYTLKLFRIRKNKQESSKIMLLWHGLLDSADSFIIGKGQSLGFELVDRGCDVWFGNSRGSKYSLGHTQFNWKTSQKYWSFNWQDMAEKDLPAAFDKIASITKTTNEKKIHYIGHSQGTSIMFANLARANKSQSITANLAKYAALGPVAYMTRVKTLMANMLATQDQLVEILKANFRFGFLLPDNDEGKALETLCTSTKSILKKACPYGIEFIADDDTSVLNSNTEFFLKHFPSGTSVQDLLYWRQLLKKKTVFEMYDYGVQKNLELYSQRTPPEYHPEFITEEIGMFVGTLDRLADATDATKWFALMQNSNNKVLHYYDLGHLAFLYPKHLIFLNDLLQFLGLPLDSKNNFIIHDLEFLSL